MTLYDAFGGELSRTGDTGEFRFAGQKGYVSDDHSGMDLLGARYDIPALGRFLTQDPIGQAGGLNLYAYCDNSPLLKVDPDGTDTRPLNSREMFRMNVVADFLTATGAVRAGAYYKNALKNNPQWFVVDDAIGGAGWEYGTLHLGLHLFDETPWANAVGRQRTVLQTADFGDKAWFASILFHEFNHVMHRETFKLYPIVQDIRGIEDRAWAWQFSYLFSVRSRYGLGRRASQLDAAMDRAIEGKHENGYGGSR